MEDCTKERIEFTIDLVKPTAENGKVLMQEDVKIDTKSSRDDFVTNVDKQTEMFIVEGIKAKYANQDFITEEKWLRLKVKMMFGLLIQLMEQQTSFMRNVTLEFLLLSTTNKNLYLAWFMM